MVDKLPTDPNETILTISAIAKQGSYLYRGESWDSGQPIKSTIFREYEQEKNSAILSTFSIDDIQAAEVAVARHYGNQSTNSQQLVYLLQHHRGKTNLIDFTEDYLIALFFACEKDPRKNARLIFLDRDIHESIIKKPDEPANRVMTQKSVFVEPRSGYIPIEDVITCTIDSTAKAGILEILRRDHGITGPYIFNDLHGYVYQRETTILALQKVAEALRHQKNGDYQAAIDAYTSASTIQPENAMPYAFRAMMHYHLNEFDKAIHDCNAAIRLSPDMSQAYNTRGLAYHATEREAAAMTDFDTAITINPQFAHAFNNRGMLLFEQHRYHEAIADIDQAIAHDPELAMAYFNSARCHIMLEHHGLGSIHIERLLRKAITIDATLSIALRPLAKQLTASGHPAASDINAILEAPNTAL